MGIAWLLLRRTFANRPKRTLLFLVGYAISTAVMITLLSVGEAVLTQARDKDLLGGGDLILAPQGIDVESMKVGGIASLYFSIPQARFIVRQILNSSRFSNDIKQVSPYLFAKILYGCRQLSCADPIPILATGSLPDQESAIKGIRLPWDNSREDNSWIDPSPDVFYNGVDHFHLPALPGEDLNRWAEWHYFNFEGSDFYGYLSLMAAGNFSANQGKWIISLQMNDGTYRRFSQTFAAKTDQLPLQTVRYSMGPTKVQFAKDHYEIDLNFSDKEEVRGHLVFYPSPGLYFPPTFLARSEQYESGYVIPAIRGRYEGNLQIGSRTYAFGGIAGYHDHNWGIWQKTHWNWGHAFSKEEDGSYTLFFGEIYVNDKSKGLFIGVFDRSGFLTVFRPEGIQFSNFQKRDHLEVPTELSISQKKNFAAIEMKGQAQTFVVTPVDDQYFIQYKMNYDVTLEIDGKKVHFPAFGNAETFVHGDQPQRH